MKLHPRTMPVQKANAAISQAVTDAIALHPDLTHAELTGILAGILTQWNRYAVRDERGENGPT